jgi:hypothetical protein
LIQYLSGKMELSEVGLPFQIGSDSPICNPWGNTETYPAIVVIIVGFCLSNLYQEPLFIDLKHIC